MELFEYFKFGKHPLYKDDLLESSLKSSVRKYIIDDFTTIYHDNSGNELIFTDGQLDSIGLRLGGNNNFKINGIELIYLSSFNYTINLFNQSEIEWWFVDKYSFKKQLCVQSTGGVKLIFDFSNKQETLTKIILKL